MKTGWAGVFDDGFRIETPDPVADMLDAAKVGALLEALRGDAQWLAAAAASPADVLTMEPRLTMSVIEGMAAGGMLKAKQLSETADRIRDVYAALGAAAHWTLEALG